jgi:hypothetical protein
MIGIKQLRLETKKPVYETGVFWAVAQLMSNLFDNHSVHHTGGMCKDSFLVFQQSFLGLPATWFAWLSAASFRKESFAMANRYIQYAITHLDNTTLVRRDGEFVESAELESIIEKLQATLVGLQNGISFDEQYQGNVSARIKELLDTEITWIEKSSLDSFLPEPPPRYMQKIVNRALFPCVYFVQNPTSTKAVKIGFTDNLSQRMNTFFHSWGKVKPKLIAVACTQYHIQFERLLHYCFSNYKHDGEWFETSYVQDWLERTVGVQS